MASMGHYSNVFERWWLIDRIGKGLYPSELELNTENNSTQVGPYLNFYLKVSSRQFSAKLFDKRDDFFCLSRKNALPFK